VDLARVLVRGSQALGVIPQLTRQNIARLVTRTEYTEGGDDLGALGIVFADDRGLRDCRVLEQRGLDLEGPDPIAEDVMTSSSRPSNQK
jgi:hypothetical protein